MKTVDPKYLNIPNICFSLTDKNDSREKEFIKQRQLRGFDDSETWSLVNSISGFIIPRLERFLEITDNKNEFTTDCELFLSALKLIQRDNGCWIFTEEEQKIVNDGIDVFPKIFMGLWW